MKAKGLRKQIKQAQKAVLDDNREWFDDFMRTHFPESGKKEKSGGIFYRYRAAWISVCSCLLVAVMALAGVLVFLPGGGSNTAQPPKRYDASERYPSKSLDIAQLNAGLTEISVDIDATDPSVGSEISCRIDQFYDEESGDTLWCLLYITYGGDDHAWIDVEIYPNLYFENTRTIGDDNLSVDFDGLSVVYSEKVEENDGIYEIDSHALVERGNTSVYIKYEGWSYRQSGKLLRFIEQTIKAV